MAFPERLLGEDEELVYDLRPHWWRLVGPGLVALLVVLTGRVLRWATTHLVLTSERLIFRSGVVAKYGREIPLERINDVTFSQSLLERLIGAGDLMIESAGEHGQSRFEDIRHPEAVQLEIYRQMEGSGRRRAGVGPAAPARPAGVLDDLERLADLRDRGAVTEEEYQRKKRELLDRL